MLRITFHILEIEDGKGRNMFLIKMFGDLILELFRRTGNNILPSFPALKKSTFL
jgi:hypothetical protein